MSEAEMIDASQPEAIAALKPKRDQRPPIPDEVLERVYEAWVAYPHQHQCMPIKEHSVMAGRVGWWFSGRRGFGPELEPLPPDLEDRLRDRDDKRDKP